MLPNYDYIGKAYIHMNTYTVRNAEKAMMSAYDIFNMRFDTMGHIDASTHNIIYTHIRFSADEMTLSVNHNTYYYTEDLDVFIHDDDGDDDEGGDGGNESQKTFVKLYAIIGKCCHCGKHDDTILYTSYNCCDACYWDKFYFQGSGIMW